MAPTYSERFIPRIKTKGLDCEGAASCTTLTTGAASCTTLTTGAASCTTLTCEGAASCTALTTGAGTVGAPAIIAPTDADSGLYWDGKNLRYAADGAQKAAFTTEGAYALTLTTGAGTTSAPAIVCPTDADTGLLWDGKNLQFAVDGVVSAYWNVNGQNAVRYATQAGMRGYRANGTQASPTATADGDTIFDFLALGHNGTGFASGAVVRFKQDGAVSGPNVPGEIVLASRNSSGGAVDVARARASGALEVLGALGHQGSTLGFYNTTPTTKPTITGSRGANAALANLLTKLAGLGLLTDSTTA